MIDKGGVTGYSNYNSGLFSQAVQDAMIKESLTGTPVTSDTSWFGSVLNKGRDALNLDSMELWGGKDPVTGEVFQGSVPTLLGLGTSVADSWLGMQQLDLARDSFAFQKDAFNKQYENQRSLTNTQLEDRQRARVASNSGAYQSVSDYMGKHGV